MTDEVFMSPVAAHQTALSHSATQDVVKLAVASSILTAVTSGLFTCTTAAGAYSSADVQYVCCLLSKENYLVSNDGTNIVVSW